MEHGSDPYADIDDGELVHAYLQKHPQYQDWTIDPIGDLPIPAKPQLPELQPVTPGRVRPPGYARPTLSERSAALGERLATEPPSLPTQLTGVVEAVGASAGMPMRYVQGALREAARTGVEIYRNPRAALDLAKRGLVSGALAQAALMHQQGVIEAGEAPLPSFGEDVAAGLATQLDKTGDPLQRALVPPIAGLVVDAATDPLSYVAGAGTRISGAIDRRVGRLSAAELTDTSLGDLPRALEQTLPGESWVYTGVDGQGRPLYRHVPAVAEREEFKQVGRAATRETSALEMSRNPTVQPWAGREPPLLIEPRARVPFRGIQRPPALEGAPRQLPATAGPVGRVPGPLSPRRVYPPDARIEATRPVGGTPIGGRAQTPPPELPAVPIEEGLGRQLEAQIPGAPRLIDRRTLSENLEQTDRMVRELVEDAKLQGYEGDDETLKAFLEGRIGRIREQEASIAPLPELKGSYQGLDTETLTELYRIREEMVSQPFTPRTWDPTGSTLTAQGEAGAAVYDDILAAQSGTTKYTRSQVTEAIDRALKGEAVHQPAEAALAVARARVKGEGVVGPLKRRLSPPSLPTTAGRLPTMTPELDYEVLGRHGIQKGEPWWLDEVDALTKVDEADEYSEMAVRAGIPENDYVPPSSGKITGAPPQLLSVVGPVTAEQIDTSDPNDPNRQAKLAVKALLNTAGLVGVGAAVMSVLKKSPLVSALKLPAGDEGALRKWLDAVDRVYGEERWHASALQALDDGNLDRAYQQIQTAAVRTLGREGISKAELDELRGMRFARSAGRSQQPKGVEIGRPPALSEATAGEGVQVGRGQILQPPRVKRPLKAVDTDLLLSRQHLKAITEATDPRLITLLRGNEDSSFRLFRQIAEQSALDINTQEVRQYLRQELPAAQIAAHYTRTVSEAARILADLSVWRAGHRGELRILETIGQKLSPQSAPARLASRLMEERGAARIEALVPGPPELTSIRTAGGRQVAVDPSRTLDQLAEQTRGLDRMDALWAVSRPDPKQVGPLTALVNFRYAPMLAQSATAIRNLWSQAGRYTVGVVEDALAAGFEAASAKALRTIGAEGAAGRASTRAAQLGGQAAGMVRGLATPGTVPSRPWAEGMDALFHYNLEILSTLPPKDARQTLSVLQQFPDEAATFLGSAAGEIEEGQTAYGWLNKLLSPKVRNLLTAQNRLQEFSFRAATFDSLFRARLRAAGVNVESVFAAANRTGENPLTTLFMQAGEGPFKDALHSALYGAMESTFAGQALPETIPGQLLKLFNTGGPLSALAKAGYPFPRFNLVSATRFLYDHSPAAFYDLIRRPWAITRTGRTVSPLGIGRLYRGQEAQRITEEFLPELVAKKSAASVEVGEHLRSVLEAQRERATMARLVRRYEQRLGKAEAIPGLNSRLGQARGQLARAEERWIDAKAAAAKAQTREKDLVAQIQEAQRKVSEARRIGAPSTAQWVARQTTGTVGLLGAALAIRDSEGAEDTRWYQWRVPEGVPGMGGHVVDFRAFAPFVQYLFVADVLRDFSKHTDWKAVREEVGAETGTVYGPADLGRTAQAVYRHYEGKYTAESLRRESAQAFLSMNRAAGTTLTLLDFATGQSGTPSGVFDTLVGVIGEFAGAFTVPFEEVRQVWGQFDPEEAKIRQPAPIEETGAGAALVAPMVKHVPGVSRVLPETISQTSGQPISVVDPLSRAGAGITQAMPDPIQQEFQRIGIGRQGYIPETGDTGLNQQLAKEYAGLLNEVVPKIMQSPGYQGRTPAMQRELLGKVLPDLKQAAWGRVRQMLGNERVGAQREPAGSEKDRSRLRKLKLLERVKGELGGTEPPEGSQEPPSL